jgi:hypothetical protein
VQEMISLPEALKIGLLVVIAFCLVVLTFHFT